MANEMIHTNGRTNGNGQALAPLAAPLSSAETHSFNSGSARRALMPRDYQEAFAMAGAMARSGLFAAKSPEQAVVILMTGMELGLAPAQAMRGIYVVQNRPVLSADMMVAICKAAKDVCCFFRLVETTDTKATYETQRVGDPEPTRLTFTMEDAKRAKLSGKEIWQAYPAPLLRARCSSGLARAVYPDLLLGLYTPEEAEDFRPEPMKSDVKKSDVKPAQNPPKTMREARAYVQGEATETGDKITNDKEQEARRRQLAKDIGEQRKRVFGEDALRYKTWLMEHSQVETIRGLSTDDLEEVLSDLRAMEDFLHPVEETEADPFEDGADGPAAEPALLDVAADDTDDGVPSGFKN